MSRGNLVKIYRGLDLRSPDGVRPVDLSKKLGMHWSKDPIIAYHYAQDLYPESDPVPRTHSLESIDPEGLLDEEDNYHVPVTHPRKNIPGMVLEGYTHEKNIVTPHSDEWNEINAGGAGLLSPSSEAGRAEQESTIRPGSTIHVVRQHLIGPQFGGVHVVEHPLGTQGVA